MDGFVVLLESTTLLRSRFVGDQGEGNTIDIAAIFAILFAIPVATCLEGTPISSSLTGLSLQLFFGLISRRAFNHLAKEFDLLIDYFAFQFSHVFP